MPGDDAGGFDAGPLDAGTLDGGASDAGTTDAGSGDAGPIDGGLCDAGPPPPSLDCTAGSSACPEIPIAGDNPTQAGAFHGYADPSIRSDPAVPNRLWMAYAYPRATTSPSPDGGAPLLLSTASIHLARSDDSGSTWTFQGVLWKAEPMADPGGGPAGFSGHEVPNLLPVPQGGGTRWYSVRLEYFLRPASGYNPDVRSFALHLASAASPEQLGTAPGQRLGSTPTRAGLFDIDLNGLHPSLSQCSFWNDPSLAFENGKLYLGAQCSVYVAGVQDEAKHKVVVFSATPAADVHSLVWSYVGVLADTALASDLGDLKLMQLDFVRGADGGLFALLNPSHHSAALGEEVHLGCRAVEIETLEPPRVRRRCGAPVVRALATTSDLAFGSGACTYDPGSVTGLVVVRRPNPTGVPGSGFSLHRTGLRP